MTRFGHLDIAYDERVLTPRPWTTHQSRWAAELAETAPDGPVLELCSGAGQIGLLAVAGTSRSLVMVDADPVACDYARRNAEAAGLADRVEVREGDLGSALRADEHFALVIADPPYLTAEEARRFPDDPPLAVLGGDDALDVARACLDVVREHLLPGGSAVRQLRDADQVAALREWLSGTGDLAVAGFRAPHQGARALARGA